jgi:hypothetical protein
MSPALHRGRALGVALLGLVAAAAVSTLAEAREGLLPEFPIETASTGYSSLQPEPAVAVGPGGEFFVVWFNPGFSIGEALRGRRFSSLGAPLGDPFPIRPGAQTFGIRPEIVTSSDGTSFVVWGDLAGIVAGQRFDASGATLGGELQIAVDPAAPELAVSPAGEVMVVWTGNTSDGTDLSSTSIQARRYDAAGNAVGPRFQVNTTTPGLQATPDVSFGSDGSAIVVWDDSDNFVRGQRYAANGSASGSEFTLSPELEGWNFSMPQVRHAPGADFVVVWEAGAQGRLYGQHFDSSANPLAPAFEIPGGSIRTDFAIDPDDEMVLVSYWQEDEDLVGVGARSEVSGRRYDLDGNPIENPFNIKALSVGEHVTPAIAIDGIGKLTVVWRSNDTVVARRTGTLVPALHPIGLLGLGLVSLVVGFRAAARGQQGRRRL